MDDPIDLINEYIVTNHNNEITAAVLNPVLQAIVLEYRDFIGDLNLLTTPVTEDVVGAINSLQQQIDDFDYTGIQVHSGIDDPNTTPPLTYAVADFYNQVDGGGDTVALWQYNGTEWVNLSVPTVGSLQQVTDVGAITDNPITVGSETDNIVIDTARIERNKAGFVTRITFDDPTGAFSANIRVLDSDEEVAFVSDVTASAGVKMIQVIASGGIVQDNQLIGKTGIFYIAGNNSTYTENVFVLNSGTGAVTGFPIVNGKHYNIFYY
jgi:hypothetical protein